MFIGLLFQCTRRITERPRSMPYLGILAHNTILCPLLPFIVSLREHGLHSVLSCATRKLVVWAVGLLVVVAYIGCCDELLGPHCASRRTLILRISHATRRLAVIICIAAIAWAARSLLIVKTDVVHLFLLLLLLNV